MLSPDDLDGIEGFDSSPRKQRRVELVIGPTHVAGGGVFLLVAVCLVGGIAYTMGKSSAAPHAVPRPAPIAVKHIEPAPTKVSAPAPAPTHAETAAAPVKEANEVVEAPPAREPSSAPANPASGLYLQVASSDRSSAQQFLKELEAKGFVGRLAPGLSPSLVRVLVGPVESDKAAGLTTSLRDAGYPAFLKRY